MKVFKTVKELRGGRGGETLGFVATMGALHQGHGSLITQSKNENEYTCVSIFVNPAQFNNTEDFKTYPNTIKKDLEFCRDLGVDYVFTPNVESIYSPSETVRISEMRITQNFEGTHRPGHFDGVLQVVMKLLNIISPSRAYFGKKDYQQYLIIKKMTEQFFLKTKIVGVSIARDEFGLALSSRNLNLTSAGLSQAQEVASAFLASKGKSDFLLRLKNKIELEYYGEDWGRVLMAHYIDGVRLIDNKPVKGGFE